MEQPDLLPELSQLRVNELKILPKDVLRVIRDQSGWKVAAAMCKSIKGICPKDYWQTRAAQEMPGEEWIVVYKYEFHNYLAARVRWLYPQIRWQFININSDVIDFDPDRQLRLSNFGITFDNLSLSHRKREGDLNLEQLTKIFEKVKEYEIQQHREFAELELPDREISESRRIPSERRRQTLEKDWQATVRRATLMRLRKYFEDQEMRDRDEILTISNFLASYLKKNYPQNFKVIDIVASASELGHYNYDKEISTAKARLTSESSREFIAKFSMLPDNIVRRFTKKGIRMNVYFQDSSGIIYIGWGLETHGDRLTAGKIFNERMGDLGILKYFYYIIYPEAFNEKGKEINRIKVTDEEYNRIGEESSSEESSEGDD